MNTFVIRRITFLVVLWGATLWGLVKLSELSNRWFGPIDPNDTESPLSAVAIGVVVAALVATWKVISAWWRQSHRPKLPVLVVVRTPIRPGAGRRS